jgi:hypothetical protein
MVLYAMGLKLKSRIDRIKEKYPVFKKHPFLFWLLLPLILLALKGVQTLGFGTLLVVISNYLKNKLDIEVSNVIIALILGILLGALVYLVYRLVRRIKNRRGK